MAGVERNRTQAGKGDWAMWREQAWGAGGGQARAGAPEVPGPPTTEDQDQVFVNLC